jgi:hypothetical protein
LCGYGLFVFVELLGFLELDRINRIYWIFLFHHFPDESDEEQSEKRYFTTEARRAWSGLLFVVSGPLQFKKIQQPGRQQATDNKRRTNF